MLDPAIEIFFKDRKEAWLKKKLTALMATAEIDVLSSECEQVFSLSEWLPSAAKRAGQISMASHPCTFSHPSARKNKNGYVSSVIRKSAFIADGFLKTGNASAEIDALGNAAALDVYKFLTLKMADGHQLLTHIQKDSDLATTLLRVDTHTYQELKEGFLSMTERSVKDITSSKIKQIYFPVEADYHLLSLLTNSGLIYELRNRIDAIRFSDEVKVMRDLKKKHEFSEQGFAEIYGLTTIGYGGTKPQNISVLNNQHGGKAHLLNSAPPNIDKRNIYFPKTNFFAESLRNYDCRDIFQALHKILKTDYNNIAIREGRDYRLQELMDRIIEKMWAVRSVARDQYHTDYSSLKSHQKIWLCDNRKEEREETNQWLDKLCKEISQWVIRSYESLMGKQAIKLGEEERLKIMDMVESNKEALR